MARCASLPPNQTLGIASTTSATGSFRSELRAFVPSCSRARDCGKQTDDAERPNVAHRLVRRETGSDIAAGNGVIRSITVANTKSALDIGWPHGGKTPAACKRRSVPIERMNVAKNPANTAPMPRRIRRPEECVSCTTRFRAETLKGPEQFW